MFIIRTCSIILKKDIKVIQKKSLDYVPSVAEASKALKMAIRKLIVERKQKDSFLVVWRNGKVVRVPAKKLKS